MPKPGALEMTTREFQFRAWGSEKKGDGRCSKT